MANTISFLLSGLGYYIFPSPHIKYSLQYLYCYKLSTGTIKHSKNRMHRVLELEPEQTNNVYADHAIDTGKQISSADSSNLPPDSSDSSAIGPSNRISQSVFSQWVQLCRHLYPH